MMECSISVPDIVAHVKSTILGRLMQLRSDLEILVSDGVDFRFPSSGRLCPTEASCGICVVLRRIGTELDIGSEDDTKRACMVLEEFSHIVKDRIPMGPRGRYPIDVDPSASPREQYCAFEDCVTHGDYYWMSKKLFNSYATARMALIDQAVEDINNAVIEFV